MLSCLVGSLSSHATHMSTQKQCSDLRRNNAHSGEKSMRLPHLIKVVLFASLLCLPFSAFANGKPKSRPQPVRSCAACTFYNSCRTCTSGGRGGIYCDTFNCGSCQESGQCMLTDSVHRAPSDTNQSIKLSAKIIRDISTKHARFAITLAEMNVYGFAPGERRIYWTPIKFAPSDVE